MKNLYFSGGYDGDNSGMSNSTIFIIVISIVLIIISFIIYLANKSSGSNFNRLNYLYNQETAIIYQNIFDALKDKIIVKSGSPNGWDETSHSVNPWNSFNMLAIGNGRDIPFPNGIKVTVPSNKNVIWLRFLNERMTCVRVFKEDGTYLFTQSNGYHNSNRYAPDGGGADAGWNVHSWSALPVPGSGTYVIVVGNNINGDGVDGWISGVAFSDNPWNHAYNPAVDFYWNTNYPGAAKDSINPDMTWSSNDWNGDILCQILSGRKVTFYVPVVASGKDKLLYIVEHNNSWVGILHKSIMVNDKPIERLRTTWVNHPLATHFNSKIYSRFVATRVPASLITNNMTSIKVTIDMTQQNNDIFFREIGTIDAY